MWTSKDLECMYCCIHIIYISNPNFLNTRHNVYSPTEMCTVTAFLSTVRAHRAKLWADFTPGMDLMSFKI